VWVDLYNTLKTPVSVRLGGPALEGRTAQAADLLGRPGVACPGGEVALAPLAYQRVMIR
jgi:hypothetical protein